MPVYVDAKCACSESESEQALLCLVPIFLEADNYITHPAEKQVKNKI